MVGINLGLKIKGLFTRATRVKPDSSCCWEKTLYNPSLGRFKDLSSKSCWVFAFLPPLQNGPTSAKALQEGNLREYVEGFMGILVAIRALKRVTTWDPT